MNLTEAAAYQDSLDAVVDMTANSVQLQEADAVINAVHRYLANTTEKLTKLKEAYAAISLYGGEKTAALKEVIDGKGVLAPSRLDMDVNGDVTVAAL